MESGHAARVVGALIEVIAEFRKAKRLTYEELADRAGIHRTTIALWERGERGPTIQLALQLAAGLGVELSELLSRAEAMTQEPAARKTQAAVPRLVQREHFHNEGALQRLAALTQTSLQRAIEGTYQTLDTIDFQLQTRNSAPLARLVELANISSMVGNLLCGQMAESSNGQYARNKPHTFPDLLPIAPNDKRLEIKIALEKNLPKGHLPKAGTYLTFRYVLGRKPGEYIRGKENRGDTVFIWEGRIGELTEGDFAFSSTEGDSGKTAVIRSGVFKEMALVYHVPEFSPYLEKRG